MPSGRAAFTFFCFHQKKVTKKSHRCMKFAKNLRHSLNSGNSSLRSSNNPQFLTLIPRFSSRKFHEAEKKKKHTSRRISDLGFFGSGEAGNRTK
jgi:hypothetical protein